MFPGAPRPHKGLEDVLIALEILNQQDLRLVIVGENPYDDYDKEIISKWGKWIIRLPRQPFEKMPEVLSSAHVIVVPQRKSLTSDSQFPLKISDGMAMAKPIITTNLGDIPRVLGKSGYIVAPNSPNQIAKTIKTIFRDYKKAEIKGREARERLIKMYSVNVMARILKKVLLNIA